VLDEAALHRAPSSPDIMSEQLAHLVHLAETHEHITVQVIPLTAGFHAGLHGSFALMEFGWPDDPGFVYVEPLGERPTYLSGRPDIYAYSSVFDRLISLALSPSETLQMLRDLAGRSPDHRGKKYIE
jgi:hypothetical protein